MTLRRLRTERLTLQPWRLADAPEFHALWGDGRVIWWGATASPEASREKLAEILERCAEMPPGMGWWAVRDRGTGRLVGNALLRPAPYDASAELGYHLLHEAWGRGYATEAARAVLRHGFGTLGLPLITAVVHVDNTASHRVMARLGMEGTGEVIHNGMPHRRYEASAAQVTCP